MSGAATTRAEPHRTQEPPDFSTLHPPDSHRSSGDGRAHFPLGALVEVHTNEDDLKNVYFSATVVRPSKIPYKRGRRAANKLSVEYKNLIAREGTTERLREDVNVSVVRPAPPFQESTEDLLPGDVVDAFYKDGWWVGTVKRVLGGGRAAVTFQFPQDELEFGLKELRVHWDWVDGCWIRHPNKSTSGSMFNVGRNVEVSHIGEDCQGAWLPAKILRILEDGSVLVEYSRPKTDKHVVAHKLTIDAMRPRPPLLKDKKFILLEKVDAFFDYGWWNGVITRALEDDRYAVFFKQMNRVEEFSHSELRPHLEWKDGKWYTSSQILPELSVPSSDVRMHEHSVLQNCTSSTPLDDLGVRNEISVGKSGQFVETTEPLKNALETTTLEDFDVRNEISVGKSGQFEGTPEPLKKSASKRYHSPNSSNADSPVLKKGKEESAQGASQDPQDLSMKTKEHNSRRLFSIYNKPKLVDRSTMIDLTSDNSSWGKKYQRKKGIVRASQNVLKINSTSPSLKKKSARISQLHGKEPESVGMFSIDVHDKDAVEATPRHLVIGLPRAEMGRSGFEETASGERCDSLSEQIEDASGHTKKLSDSKINTLKASKQVGIEEKSSQKKRGRPRKICIEENQTPLAILALEPVSVENLFDKDKLTTPISDLNVVKGSNGSRTELVRLPEKYSSRRTRSTGGERTVPARKHLETEEKSSKKKRGRPPKHRGTEENSSKKKRGRPPNIRIEDIQTPLANDLGCDDDLTLTTDPALEPVSLENLFDKDKLATPVSDLNVVKESNGSRTEVIRPPEKPRDTGGERTVPAPQDSLDASRKEARKADSAVESENFVCEAPGTDSDNEPLSKWMKEMTAPSTHNQSGLSSNISSPHVENSKKQSEGAVLENSVKEPQTGSQVSDLVGEKGPNIGTTPPGSGGNEVFDLVDEAAVVPNEQQMLPFVKTTALWQTIESMEVFQKMPQRPHFRPLENSKQDYREGLAIGHMVTFASVVDKAAKLRLDDPKSIMDNIIEILAGLEEHGFNVKTVKDYISDLLALKCDREKLIHELNELNCQMLEQNNEASRIEEELLEYDKQIKKLQEKRAVTVSAWKIGDESIALLAAKLKESEAKIQDAESNFVTIASSEWNVVPPGQVRVRKT